MISTLQFIHPPHSFLHLHQLKLHLSSCIGKIHLEFILHSSLSFYPLYSKHHSIVSLQWKIIKKSVLFIQPLPVAIWSKPLCFSLTWIIAINSQVVFRLHPLFNTKPRENARSQTIILIIFISLGTKFKILCATKSYKIRPLLLLSFHVLILSALVTVFESHRSPHCSSVMVAFLSF